MKLKAFLDGGSDDGDQPVDHKSLRHAEDAQEEEVPPRRAIPLQAIRVEPQEPAVVFVAPLGAASGPEQPRSNAQLGKADPEGGYGVVILAGSIGCANWLLLQHTSSRFVVVVLSAFRVCCSHLYSRELALIDEGDRFLIEPWLMNQQRPRA